MNHEADPPVGRATRRSRGKSPSEVTPSPAAEREVRVLCVDDHAVLVQGLKAQFELERGIRFVGHLPSAEGLVEEVERLRPDVVLLDIEMPGPDVFEAADRLRRMHPEVRFVFLSAHVRDGYLSAAYRCGAWGYFAKGDELDDIVAGIKEVGLHQSGTFVMGPKVRERCQPAHPAAGGRPRRSADAHPRLTTAIDTLTPREIEVLRLIGKGKSRNEIAAELCRSAKTIDGHQERMMKKLGIDSRAELMRFAIREGLAEA